MNRLHMINIYEEINYTAFGIIALQSALKGGECIVLSFDK